MNKLVTIIIIILLTFSNFVCFSQNGTNSPYSYYGIGEFNLLDHSQTAGIGGVGIGIKTNSFINQTNPASYSSIDSLNFLFDIALSGSLSKFESYSNHYNILNGNISKVAMGFRVYPFWSTTFGLMPYTSVGYKTTTLKSVEGTTDYFNITSEGKGGINKVFWGNSFKINDNISLGINSSILFGYIEKSELYTYSQISSYYWQAKNKYKSQTAMYFDIGAQYSNNLNSNWGYVIGATGGLNSKIKMIQYFSLVTDTSYYTTDEYKDYFNFWIPTYGGIGASVYSRKWLFAIDYRFQNWSSVRTKNEQPRLADSHHLALGAQYCPNNYLGKTIFQRMTYQAGFHYDRSYIEIGANNYDIFGFTMGVVIPVRNQMSSINISLDAGQKGRITNGMFKENYFQLNLSFNFADIWFQKRRFN